MCVCARGVCCQLYTPCLNQPVSSIVSLFAVPASGCLRDSFQSSALVSRIPNVLHRRTSRTRHVLIYRTRRLLPRQNPERSRIMFNNSSLAFYLFVYLRHDTPPRVVNLAPRLPHQNHLLLNYSYPEFQWNSCEWVSHVERLYLGGTVRQYMRWYSA